MPTNKPQVKAYIEPELKEKLIAICNSENRSESNMIEYLIKKYIDEYDNHTDVENHSQCMHLE